MKKILIIIQDLESGGAQKSLLSFLKCLINTNNLFNYKIDLLVAKPEGIFYSKIPDEIRKLQTPKELVWIGVPLRSKILRKYSCLNGCIGKIKWIVGRRMCKNTTLNDDQMLWKVWRSLISENKNKYDIAISYMNGFPNYYVMDKVHAKKKILWIHNEYQKLNYNIEFDRPYYEACDRIITISQKCLESFTDVFPEFKDKIFVLENITIAEDIINMGNMGVAAEFNETNKLKLLSVGRLAEQKGFDIAIESAKILKERGLDFIWLILGEGPDRERLQTQIDRNNLNEHIRMIGTRENPYVYIKECDIFVQTSRFEGKSIVLDEAKIFCKPIVVTNYPTVGDSIANEKNGLIVEMDAMSIVDGIEKLAYDDELKRRFMMSLSKEKTNEDSLKRYIELMLDY